MESPLTKEELEWIPVEVRLSLPREEARDAGLDG